jgi:transposase
MDRRSLELCLAHGLSLKAIGRRLGRHEATVAYWVDKHGLQAANRDRHVARGALRKADLERLVRSGASIAEIATDVDRSKATVRHWLARFGLKTSNGPEPRRSPEAQAAKEAGLASITAKFPRHGDTGFCLDGRGRYRCKRCRSDAVTRRRRKMKAILVQEAGGACRICGYSSNMRALHLYHIKPADKRLELNAKGISLSLETLRAEARKCVLLCANCHAEVEAGMITLAQRDSACVQWESAPGSCPG